MICHVAFAKAAPGKWKEAEQWFLQVATYVNKKYPIANARIMSNIADPNDTLYYVDYPESLGFWEEVVAAMETDPDWHALAAKTEGLLVPGSVHHRFYRIAK